MIDEWSIEDIMEIITDASSMERLVQPDGGWVQIMEPDYAVARCAALEAMGILESTLIDGDTYYRPRRQS